MATQPTPQELQELIRLYQQVEGLTASQADNAAQLDVNLGRVANQTRRLLADLTATGETFSSIASALKGSIQEFSKYNTFASSAKKSFSSLQSITSRLLNDQSGYNRLSEKEIVNLKKKISLETTNLTNLQNSVNLTDEQKSEVEGVLTAMVELSNLTKKRLEKEKEISKATGITGNALKALSKIPGLSNALDTEEALEDMKEYADTLKSSGKDITSFGNKLKIAGKGFSTAFGGLKTSLKDPVSLITFFVAQAFKANSQAVELGKSLGTAGEGFRETLSNIELANSNINVTTENLTKAFSELSTSTGFAYKFSEDQLVTQVKLTEQVGLQADEAAQIQRYGVLNNQTSEKTYSNFVKGLVAARNQFKVGIDFKATLAEAVKVSGQLAANLGYNPERIAKAIVTAKAFGMTLDQVAKSGESLLNWESSIDNELKAELLTGKQLNLEKARYAALTGDQVTLAEELANQVGTAADFTKMNVLQQKALAESVGMTADELSNTLRKREEAIASGKSLAQVTEEEAKQALERQKAQDKFNKGIEKLTSLIGNLLAGPLGMFLDIVSDIFSIVTKIISKIQDLLGSGIAKTLIGAIGGFLVGGPIGALIGGIGGAASATMADDMMSGYGERTLLTPNGAVALNNSDTVIAGTNLFKGDDVASFPKGALNLGGNVDLTPMIAAINEVRASVDRLYNKNTTINMDSKQVGSTLVQSSYKLA
jgi:hypothetical protein